MNHLLIFLNAQKLLTIASADTDPWIANASHVWIIEPRYIKYWDDALFGTNGTKEFTFDS